MIVVRLKGGMGNQMFQYAFGLRMAHQLDTALKLDLSLLLDRSKKDMVFREYDLDVFQVEPSFLTSPSILRTVYRVKSSRLGNMVQKVFTGKWKEIKEPHFQVVESLLSEPIDNVMYNGWWQSERYFAEVEQQLRQVFRFQDARLPEAADLYQQIEQTNSVCLNVRRTDFLKTPDLNTTNLSYFEQSVEHILKNVSDPHFFVFSDDVDWCRDNIKIAGYPVNIIDHKYKGRKFGNYLQMMSCCKHFIIPNSSFAWWAVWLGGSDDKIVVAPKNWFANPAYDTSDLVPVSWMRV